LCEPSYDPPCVNPFEGPLTTKIAYITVAYMLDNEVDPEKINGPDVVLEAMKDEKMTARYLVKRLKREMKAKKLTRLKVNGVVTPEKTATGRRKAGAPRVVGTSGVTIEVPGEGNADIYGDGETVLEFSDEDMHLQQKARMDAHKLRGDYPSEKHDLKVTGDLTVIVKKYDWEDDTNSPEEA